MNLLTSLKTDQCTDKFMAIMELMKVKKQPILFRSSITFEDTKNNKIIGREKFDPHHIINYYDNYEYNSDPTKIFSHTKKQKKCGYSCCKNKHSPVDKIRSTKCSILKLLNRSIDFERGWFKNKRIHDVGDLYLTEIAKFPFQFGYVFFMLIFEYFYNNLWECFDGRSFSSAFFSNELIHNKCMGLYFFLFYGWG